MKHHHPEPRHDQRGLPSLLIRQATLVMTTIRSSQHQLLTSSTPIWFKGNQGNDDSSLTTLRRAKVSTDGKDDDSRLQHRSKPSSGDKVMTSLLTAGHWCSAKVLPSSVDLVMTPSFSINGTADGKFFIKGGAGDDSHHCFKGANTVYGGQGDDTIDGAAATGRYLLRRQGDDKSLSGIPQPLPWLLVVTVMTPSLINNAAAAAALTKAHTIDGGAGADKITSLGVQTTKRYCRRLQGLHEKVFRQYAHF